MNAAEFRIVSDEYLSHRPFAPEDMAAHRRLWTDMRRAAEPEHEGTVGTEFMTDWVECRCGWKSNRYWDLVESAWDEWVRHVRALAVARSHPGP